MSELFSRVTPGVMSMRASLATSSGWARARAIEVAPPSDIPTTIRAVGARAPMTTATSSAMARGLRTASSPGQSECPCPGRSTATSGRSRARATVSQVWAFCPPPWMNTTSGGSVPVQGRPTSLAFSWNIENSS